MDLEFSGRPPRVLVTKIGLDGHDRGSRIVASALRDAGMEVIYTGPWQKIPDVVKMAAEEDVDVVGISSLSGDHFLIPKLMEAFNQEGLVNLGVVFGGIVPDEDEKMLLRSGVARVFHPGHPLEDMVNFIAELTGKIREKEQSL